MKVTLVTRDGQETCISSDTAPHDGEIIPCLRCGVCCTRWQPQLDPEEVSVVAQHLRLSTEEFQRDCIAEHPRRFGLHLLRRDEGHCLFLAYKNDEAECTINAFKPVACRKWTPSLFRPECQKGLKKRRPSDVFILPGQIYHSQDDLDAFCRSLERSKSA